ncbi:TRAF3-interacting JNK-activating modulator isoform X2 [Coregonus clupeaformis]|uniref:TRAF3-interacting JNK-activating modulator isoform X2 n=1 Tax=Coregonus clupeaformis TaxID=59861 RepID=UPI001BDFC73F|nr:TRAF3-interacting JNK-activating modulator isoform X2 [Coregonus clupeaformis]
METLDITLTHWFQVREYDQKSEQREEKHKELRGRNNVTSCRSPTRELDTRWIKKELRRKRQQEFHRRRSVSPERAKASGKVKDDSCVICDTAKSETVRAKASIWTNQTPVRKNEKSSTRTLEAVFSTLTTSTRQPPTSTPTSTPTICTSTREPPTSTPTSTPTICTSTREPPTSKKNSTRKQDSVPHTSTPIKEPHTSTPTSTPKTSTPSRELVQPRLKASTKKDKGILKGTGESNRAKKRQQEASVQTEPGYVTVKESEVLQLADYLQEALWREEGLKNKLAVLQKRGSTLLHHSDTLWTTRCNEDLLKNKIRALETQLQVCLQKQKLPWDGVKLALQMEKQKGAYEEKALEAIQRATEEKQEALSQAETLEMLLQAARVESAQWQGLCEEMKDSSEQLKKRQEINSEQVLQLQNQLELARGQEAGLREELGAVQQMEEELQSNIVLLEEQNQNLRDQIQEMRDARAETQEESLEESLAQLTVLSEESEECEQTLARLTVLSEESEECEQTLAQLTVSLEQPKEEEEEEEEEQLIVSSQQKQLSWGDGDQVAEQLRHTLDRLQLKERECEELQNELEAVEAECQSCQVRLTQCRDELRQLSHRRSSRKPCVSWLWLCVLLLTLLSMVAAAILWAWHPPFKDQIQDLYSAVEEHIEDYLLQAASPQHVGCFRPI